MQGFLFGRPKPIAEWEISDGRFVLPALTDNEDRAVGRRRAGVNNKAGNSGKRNRHGLVLIGT
jgi:hypothetical protein